jgi:dTDP-4-amino-4,6-dideoxygalactose transaminase
MQTFALSLRIASGLALFASIALVEAKPTGMRSTSARAPMAQPRTRVPAEVLVNHGPHMSRFDERKTCPVPEEGIEHAVKLMRDGMLFRYTYPSGETSPVSEVESALATFTGHKFCVAVNSGASALYLSMRAAGVEPGDKVLCNAFTFGAVPSAIVHAGAEVVYVESNEQYTLDTEDLVSTLKEHPDAKALMLSHMRGRVGEMDAIKRICDDAGVLLLEDCAHSLGVRYNGQHTGHHALACGVSAQAFKLLNSGEGGFVLTDDAEVAMRAATLAGAYESNALKHDALPEPTPRFKQLPVDLPNLSLRMSALAASVLIPQIGTLDARIAEYEVRYQALKTRLAALPAASAYLSVPDDLAEVTPVHDELLFTITPEALAKAGGQEAVGRFMQACAARGLTMNL